MGKQKQQVGLEEPEEESIQVSLRRARSEERASIEAKRWKQEKLDRRSMSPEHTSAARQVTRAVGPASLPSPGAGTLRGEATGMRTWRSTGMRPDQGGCG